MEDDILKRDILDSIEKAREIKDVVDRIYYSKELGTLFNKPFLTMLSTGASFLHKNLRELYQRYQAKMAKEG